MFSVAVGDGHRRIARYGQMMVTDVRVKDNFVSFFLFLFFVFLFCFLKERWSEHDAALGGMTL